MLRVVYKNQDGEYASVCVLSRQLNAVRRALAQGGLRIEFIVREN